MKNKKKEKGLALYDRTAYYITRIAGSPYAFGGALLLVLLWGICGPVFHFSQTWQLVINTGTTIITFLMVFVIQQTQNKDTMALQLKLNELIACNSHASNRLISIEDLTEEELDMIKSFYHKLVDLASKESDISKTHSFDEARISHRKKLHGAL